MKADALSRLIGELSRLPGIGPKTATRLAHYLLKIHRKEAVSLAEAIVDVKDRLTNCHNCNAITENILCSICDDPLRDQTTICIVEEPFNIPPIERTGEHKGLYHVLLGALSPQRGIGPNDLALDQLLNRLDKVQEIIIATNPNVEGEATALYLSRVLKAIGKRVTRLAFGMPVGGDIEYTDEVTLGRSFAGRREL